MRIFQTVNWLDMPEPIKTQFQEKELHRFGHYTYYSWDPWDYEYQDYPEDIVSEDDINEELYVKAVDTWLVSQGCDLNKPILILIDW